MNNKFLKFISYKLLEYLSKKATKKNISFEQEEWRLLRYSFSQFGEDRILESIFKNQAEGFYIDVGAFDPIRYSNTNIFYKNGWKGINIEPNPEKIKIFDRLRPRDINLNVGISDEETEMHYYQYASGATNRFLPSSETNKLSVRGEEPISSTKISVKTLSTILQKYLPKTSKIDFLSIDCEGLDLNVLKGNNWDLYRPRIIAIEDLSVTRDSSIEEFLNRQGYTLIGLTGLTKIFKLKHEILYYENHKSHRTK
jgi:FkbM family methyltransferase